MGRVVALHWLAVILAIAAGVLVSGIVGGLVAVPLLAVFNTAGRYLAHRPGGEQTPDRTPAGHPAHRRLAGRDRGATDRADQRGDPAAPPPADICGDRADEVRGNIDDQRPAHAAEEH
ncbi:AI-2E family transporter [Micromonospora sp. NPDC047620]|uniref:AI-2E family transporter n=1 Tax=Micromonospora sp. NPDC047620 TaxID=3364251 RepID=UPI003719422C